MKYLFIAVAFVAFSSCMKSKEEYKQAINEIQEEQEIQREEEPVERNDQRRRGANDAEGMGMDE